MTEFNDASSLYLVGETITFRGYVDDFDHSTSAIQFSLDGGANWTTYPTANATADRGLRWTFEYTPQVAGSYLLRARAVDGLGQPSPLTANFPFVAVGSTAGCESVGQFHLRAIGGRPLREAKLFRSAAIANITSYEAGILSNDLGIRAIYDIRGAFETSKDPEPFIPGAKTITLEPSAEGRRKDASKRLVAGVIGQYGAPEERMRANYRRYALEYPLIGSALRSIADENVPALVHCVNGKDRTGVLSAIALRIAGFAESDILADYLLTNRMNAAAVARERTHLGRGMTTEELEILDSFLEARPSYLTALFDAIDEKFGSFETYVAQGLRLSRAHCECLTALLTE